MTSPGYPAWFRGLRFVLTFVAVASLVTSLLCKMILGKEKEEKEETAIDQKKEESN